jgi:competence protein ComGC
MKFVGILLSLLVSAIVIYLTLQNIQSGSKNADPLGLTQPIEKAKKVQSALDLSAVQLAVQAYQAQQGNLPKNLSDLVSTGILNEAQIKNLNYDPESGKVTSGD